MVYSVVLKVVMHYFFLKFRLNIDIPKIGFQHDAINALRILGDWEHSCCASGHVWSPCRRGFNIIPVKGTEGHMVDLKGCLDRRYVRVPCVLTSLAFSAARVSVFPL